MSGWDYKTFYQQSKQLWVWKLLHFPSADIDLSGLRIMTAFGNSYDANLHDDRKANGDARRWWAADMWGFFFFNCLFTNKWNGASATLTLTKETLESFLT